MTCRIVQDSAYEGKDYWRWWAWIEADAAELGRISKVTWILHPTFEQTRVERTDPSDNFRIERTGWGTFLLRAEVHIDTEVIPLRHMLALKRPGAHAPAKGGAESGAPVENETPGSPSRPMTFYLSYGGSDARLAAQVKQRLEKDGVHVLSANSLVAGNSVESIGRLISRADAVVGIIGDTEVSPFVVEELETAVASAKPSLALVREGVTPEGLPSAVATKDLNATLDTWSAAGLLGALKISGA